MMHALAAVGCSTLDAQHDHLPCAVVCFITRHCHPATVTHTATTHNTCNALQARQRTVRQAVQEAAAADAAVADKAYAAMEEMLGKAAAKAWRLARRGARAESALSPAPASLARAGQLEGLSSSSGPICSSTGAGPASNTSTPCPSTAGDGAPAASAAASAAANVRLIAAAEPSSNIGLPADVRADGGSNGDSIGYSTEASAAPLDSPGAAAVPCSPRTAAAMAAQLLAAAAAAPDPVAAVKLHLAALGVRDPADVSRTLLAELGARANLDGLLQAVAAYLERQGLPRRLNKKSSLKITKELNKR